MSDEVIPKERLTAYQRWELPAFNDSKPSSGKRISASELPTAGQLEQMHQLAHDEGYRAGFAEAAENSQRIAGLLQSLNEELQKVDQQISQDLLELALEIASQMVHQALEAKPELLLNVINEAIAGLPHFNQGAHLVLHPADAEMVRKQMGERLTHSNWKIFEDTQIERGGCRVETAHSQIDATLAARWKHVVASIGQDSSWLKQ
jgi:flagellar assembly protein FliH